MLIIPQNRPFFNQKPRFFGHFGRFFMLCGDLRPRSGLPCYCAHSAVHLVALRACVSSSPGGDSGEPPGIRVLETLTPERPPRFARCCFVFQRGRVTKGRNSFIPTFSDAAAGQRSMRAAPPLIVKPRIQPRALKCASRRRMLSFSRRRCSLCV